MENCINGAKSLIDRQVNSNAIERFGIAFSAYQKVYFWTNENIGAYLDSVNFYGKENACAVSASGDHAFNLITSGIKNIDTFDVNLLTEYFAFGFKRALILRYDYESFLKTINTLLNPETKLDEITDIVRELFPYMEQKHKIFWNTILDYNYTSQKEMGTNLNLFLMLSFGNNHLEATMYNNYLLNRENYELLRNRLGYANISFRSGNALSLSTHFNDKYDFILLSNIIDYFSKSWGMNWTCDKLQEYISSLEEISKDDCIIFLKYIYYYTENRKHIIPCSSVTKDDLEGFEIISFQSKQNSKTNDGMILKRVNKL